MKRDRKVFAVAVIGALTFAACKHELNEPTPVAGTFRVTYGFHWDGTSDLDLDSTYADVSGHAIRFTAVKFFMGAVHLENNGFELARYEHRYAPARPMEIPASRTGICQRGITKWMWCG